MFLPVTLTGYYLLRKKYRNGFLFIVSLWFYAWGEPKFVIVMVGSILFNYLAALLIDWFRDRKFLSKSFLIFNIIGNLGLLFIYKYLDFSISNINRLGFNLPLKGLVLPIGISFFTFQAMSYVIDVYRGDVEVQRKPHYVGLYISFFPQLIAGPIVRYKDIEAQITDRKVNFDLFSEGVRRFIIGFSKKIILANNMALLADEAFGLPANKRSVVMAWLGVIAYAFQIFFDFSGYSDMAIGLGKMFGFNFLENFNYPYLAKSISDFWRRWHISLGSWFRDYVYFPLGGSHVKTKARLVFNLFIVWLLTGGWHGASWNFVVWGLFYFLLIAFEKLTGYPEKLKAYSSKLVYRVWTLLSVLAGWVLFRAVGLKAALKYGLSMFALSGNPFSCANASFAIRQYGVLLVVSLFCSTDLFKNLSSKLSGSDHRLVRISANAIALLFYVFVFVWGVSYIILGSHNPFIYFNF